MLSACLVVVGCEAEQTSGRATRQGNVPSSGVPSVGGGVQAAAPGIPCDVTDVMAGNCWGCHASQTQFGAPMSLVTHADFMAPTPTNPSVPVYQSVSTRIHHVSMPMPPPSYSERLDMPELAVLDNWIGVGAPQGSGGVCAASGDAILTGGGAGAGGGTEFVGADPTYDPNAALPDDVECFEFRAHSGDKVSPFMVNAGALDEYYNFTFLAPWEGDVQAISFRTIVDNTNVIHHWLLYQAPPGSGVVDGAVGGSSGTHGADELVSGWAPGASDNILPADVGMVVYKALTLEIHYNNPSAVVEPDSSGVQVCVTHNPRPNVAGLHWLGTDLVFTLGAGEVSGVCTPTSTEPIHILTSWPHMHLLGTHMKTQITRADGSLEMLHDAPFDFNYQISYDTPAVIMPGDVLTTTCTYSGAATFGPGTSSEMCYNFVLAYPNGSLNTGGGITSFANHCML